jgi:hypothetical protein
MFSGRRSLWLTPRRASLQTICDRRSRIRQQARPGHAHAVERRVRHTFHDQRLARAVVDQIEHGRNARDAPDAHQDLELAAQILLPLRSRARQGGLDEAFAVGSHAAQGGARRPEHGILHRRDS